MPATPNPAPVALPYQGERTTWRPPEALGFDEPGYRSDIETLEQIPLWTGKGGVAHLWSHQKEAVALGAAYTRVAQANPIEGALIKMPTGTGKSGVVALLARCLPEVRRVLVLTPREGLVQQMKEDLSWRFWRNMKLTNETKQVWSGDGVLAGRIEILLSNKGQADKLLNLTADAGRLTLVGTLQALDLIRTDRDRLLRRMRYNPLSAKDGARLTRLEKLLDQLAGFDLVIVDEGHYEPAPSWSRSVRSLGLPTLLLSATPFRNDYKLFSVRGAFAFNLPLQPAVAEHIIRDVTFSNAGAASGAEVQEEEEGNQTVGAVPAPEANAIREFAKALVERTPELLAPFPSIPAKIIVRAASFSALAALQHEIESLTEQTVALIHEQIQEKANQAPGRFVTVKQAKKERPDATYWLHQSKLLEGIDEPTFVAVALLDGFTNDRQLIQQIGRVLRSTDPERSEAQRAHVIARNVDAQTRIERSWAQYLAFEEAGAGKIESIIPGEAYLPQRILPQMPERQYVDGRFRERLPGVMTLASPDILLPRRATIFSVDAGFDPAILETETFEAILARSRFLVQPIAKMPADSWGWTFFTVGESPYLSNHFVTEWRFGLCVMVKVNERLFVFDSDGVAFDRRKIGVNRLPRTDLVRLFGPDGAQRSVRITKMAASSIDMSDRAIRALAMSTASFENTFTDLLDNVLLPTNVAGYVGGEGRYLGLTRSKLSDESAELIGVEAFIAWAKAIDEELNLSTSHNRVFDRFAQVTYPNPTQAAEPVSILLELEPFRAFNAFANDQEVAGAPETPPLADLCADINKGAFKVQLADGEKIPCTIRYNPKSDRYSIASDKLNARAISRQNRSGIVQTLTEEINSKQAFRILTSERDKIYMMGEWVKAKDPVQDGRLPMLDMAEAVPALDVAYVEKGEADWAAGRLKEWERDSLFGLTKAYLADGLQPPDAYAKALAEFPLVLLDDDGQEMADFILVSDSKIVLLHAKASRKKTGNTGAAVTALQEVGRQVTASLAFFLTSDPDIADDRYSRAYTANKTAIPAPPPPDSIRVFRNRDKIAVGDIAAHVRAALRDRRRNKEVWLVGGKLFKIGTLRRRAKKGTISNRDRQLLMYIEALTTTCGRANATFRIFAS